MKRTSISRLCFSIVFAICNLLLFSFSLQAQNLVPNPGFEDHYNCPQGISEVPSLGGLTYGVKNWTAPGPGTSDYYNTCATNGSAGVPNNIFGYQLPHSGNAYVGCYTMLYYLKPQLDTYREYVETQLTQPLQQNHLYNVSFYVNTAATDGVPYLQGYDYSFWATDGVGAYLSGNYVTGLNLFTYTPQVAQPAGQILSDTAGWTLVSGYMQGNGEQYITIGNFKRYQQMTMSHIMQTSPVYNGWYDTISYVFIDDVNVTPITTATNDTVLCDTVGFSKTLQGYQGGTGYLWNTGDTTAQITVHNTGTYWYEVHYGSYTIKDTVRIQYLSRQQLQHVLHDTSICSGATISVKAPGGYSSYEWHANGTIYHTQTVPVFTAGTVVLQVTDTCGVMADSFRVRFIQQLPLTGHFSDTTVCAGTSLSYAAPAGYLSYQWHYNNTTATSQSVTISQPGSVVLQVSDSCKTYADTFIIHYRQPLPLIHLHDTTICSGTTVFITAPNGYDTYEWQYNNNTYAAQSITISNAGKVVLHVSDLCGTQADSFIVSNKQLHPLTTHLPDTAFCTGASLNLEAPAGYLSYLWLFSDHTASGMKTVTTTGGLVLLQVQDSCLTYTDSFMVNVKPVPLPPVTTDTTICPGAVIITLPAYGHDLLWYTSPADKNGTIAIPAIPATGYDPFTVYVTQTVNGCESNKASLQVGFYQEPVISLPADTVFCTGDVYKIGYQLAEPAGYKWSTGETTPFIHPAVAGIYQLTVSNTCGSVTAAANVQLTGCDKCFWMPDAFTPNGDGRNDRFGPVRTCPAHFHYYLFKIYNRWGQLVFESMSSENKWDGSFGGSEQPLGTYTYTLEYRSTATAPTTFGSGTLELVR